MEIENLILAAGSIGGTGTGGGSTPPVQAPAPVSTRTRVLLTGGQSNSVGEVASQIPDSKAHLRAALPFAKIWKNGTFETLQAGVNTSGTSDAGSATDVGAETNHCYLVNRFWNDARTEYVVKSAKNGTAIAAWLTGGNERANLFNACLNGLAAISADPANYSTVFYWDQGESDGNQGLAHAQTYGQKLKTLIEDLRATLPARKLPVVLRKHRIDVSNNFPEIAEIIKQQQWVLDNVPDVHIIAGDDLRLGDAIHFDTPGQIELGKRLADKTLYLFD